MSAKDPIKVERDGHLAWLTLDRPKKLNAMGLDFFPSLKGLMAEVSADPAIRAVIIKARGKAFSAGIDLDSLAGLLRETGAAGREGLKKVILELQEAMTAVERCSKPVIGAAHSLCLGGGVDLLSACDIRLASADAVFSIRETKMAIIADLGTLQRLPAIIGQGRFRELALTGRDFKAQEALEMGFVNRVFATREELLAGAEALAQEIAANAPLAVQGTKEVILFSRDNGISAGLRYVAQKNAAVLDSEDLLEAIQAYQEKRPPKFKGR